MTRSSNAGKMASSSSAYKKGKVVGKGEPVTSGVAYQVRTQAEELIGGSRGQSPMQYEYQPILWLAF